MLTLSPVAGTAIGWPLSCSSGNIQGYIHQGYSGKGKREMLTFHIGLEQASSKPSQGASLKGRQQTVGSRAQMCSDRKEG